METQCLIALFQAILKNFVFFQGMKKKQDDMRHRLNNPKLNFIIGDVRDFESINAAMSGVDYVFSAAALKQVPSCEFYPMVPQQSYLN